MNISQNFGAIVLAETNARTETEYEKLTVPHGFVESVKRGVNATDYMAWVNGDRKAWGAGPTRQEAIDSAIRNHATR